MTQQPNSRLARQAGQPTPASKRVIETVSTEHHALNRNQSPAKAATATNQAYSQSQAPRNPRVSAVPLDTPTQQVAPQVEQPAKTDAEVNSQYQAIDLPSGFEFYEFKTLTIRPLKGMDQAKLHMAATQNSIRHTVEAISATLGDGVSALDLTPQDFYYLMYWQRTQSFLKTPMVVRASCSNEQHNEDVLLGRWNEDKTARIPLDEKTLELSIHVDKTTLKVKNLELTDAQRDPATYPAINMLDLSVETMRDIVFAADKLIDLEDLAEAEWLAGYAAFLKPQVVYDKGSTTPRYENLLERMDRVKEFTPDQISELDEYILTMASYGVSESTTIKCPECTALNEVVIPFDARTFLPHPKRG